MARIFFEDTMIFGSLSATAAAGIIAGSVNTYADLPDATTNNGKLYYVKTGTTGALGMYLYPRGFYFSTGGVWQGGRIQVNVSQDTNSFVNITNWTNFNNSDPSFNIGDVVRYNDVFYKNLTGTYSATSPASDTTNWKSLKLNATNQYYVSSGGDNTADGLTQPTAVEDFSTALGLASAGDTIYCEDASVFDETITGVAGVNIYAPKSTLAMTSNKNITLNNGSYIFDTIKGDNDNSLILGDASGGYALIKAREVELQTGGGGKAIRNTSGDLLDVQVEQMYLNGTGDGIADFSGAGSHIHIDIDDIYCANTGTGILIENGGTLYGYVQHIQNISGGTGKAIDVNDGTVNLKSNFIGADIDVGASGNLKLTCEEITGDINIDAGGVLNVWCPNFSGALTNGGTIFGQLGDTFYGVETFNDGIISPSITALSSAGGTLKTMGGTTALSWGSGGGNNVSTADGLNVGGALTFDSNMFSSVSTGSSDNDKLPTQGYVDDAIGGVLASVSTDTTLTGDGTSGTPLGIDLTNSNTWTGLQRFDGSLDIIKDGSTANLKFYDGLSQTGRVQYTSSDNELNFRNLLGGNDLTLSDSGATELTSNSGQSITLNSVNSIFLTCSGAGKVETNASVDIAGGLTQTNGVVEFLKDANDNDLSIYYDATNWAYFFDKSSIDHNYKFGGIFEISNTTNSNYLKLLPTRFEVNYGTDELWFTGDVVFNRSGQNVDFIIKDDSGDDDFFYDASENTFDFGDVVDTEALSKLNIEGGVRTFGIGTVTQNIFVRGNGTTSSPTKVLNGDNIGIINNIGYTDTNVLTGAQIRFVASEDWSSSSGADIDFWTCDNGSGSVSKKMSILNNGEVFMPNVYSDGLAGTYRDLYIKSDGQLMANTSKLEAKNNVTPVEDTSWIYNIEVKNFEYRETDEEGNYLETTDGIKRIGAIADDMLNVKREVVITDNEGNAEAIYDKQVFWAMLDQLQKQKQTIDDLTKRVETLESA